jgi:hypothetical protein
MGWPHDPQNLKLFGTEALHLGQVRLSPEAWLGAGAGSNERRDSTMGAAGAICVGASGAAGAEGRAKLAGATAGAACGAGMPAGGVGAVNAFG